MSAPAAALLAALICPGAPSWSEKVNLEPADAEPLKIQGPRAPKGLMLVKGNRETRMTVEGPGELQLRLHLLTLRQGSKGSAIITLQIDDNRPARLALPRKPQKRWKLPSHPLFGLGHEQSLALMIPYGTHEIVLAPLEGSTLGLALRARIGPLQNKKALRIAARALARDGAKTDGRDASSEVDDEPPLLGDPGPAGAPPLLGGGSTPEVEEPPLLGGPSTPDTEEPPLLGRPGPPGAPTGDPPPPPPPGMPLAPDRRPAPREAQQAPKPTPAPSTLAREPSLALRGEPYPPVEIETPRGTESFALATVDRGVDVDVDGPCVVMFEIHTHRSEAEPETLEPVIVALLINDVLAQTFSLEQPTARKYRAVDQDFDISYRTTFRVPVRAGAHNLQFTVSDNAVLGTSFRLTLNPNAAPDPSGYAEELPTDYAAQLDAELTAVSRFFAAPGTTAINGTLHAGLWVPSGITGLGVAAHLEGAVRLPIETINLSIGLSGGLQWSGRSDTFADPRQPEGRSTVGATVIQIPLVAQLVWAFSRFGRFALELGAGGGVVLGISQAVVGEASTGSSPQPAAAGAFFLGSLIDVDAGEIVIRATYQATDRIDSGPMRNLYGSGFALTVGYRMGTAFE